MESTVQEAIDTLILKPVFRNNESLFLCEPCNTEVTGTIPAAAHLAGSKHLKAMRRFLAGSAKENGVNILSDNGKLSNFKDDAVNFQQLLDQGILKEFLNNGIHHYQCCVCNCDMNGDVPTKSHLEGSSHAKKLKVMGLKNILPGSSSNLMSSTRVEVASPIASSAPEKSLHNISNISLPTADNLSIVDTSYDKSSRLAQHVESGMLLRYSKLGAVYYDCTVCSCSVTGDVPAIAHLDGKPHKRAAVRKELQSSCYSNTLHAASSNSSMQSIDSTDGGAVALATGKQIPSSSLMDAPASLTDNLAAIALSDAQQISSTSSLLSSALSDGVLRHDQNAALADSYYCVVCEGPAMIGLITADTHLRGKNHAKVCKRKAISAGRNGVASRSSSSSRDGDVDTEDESSQVQSCLVSGVLEYSVCDGSDVYKCVLCNVAMRGTVPAELHIKGKQHSKMMNRKANSDISNRSEQSRLHCKEPFHLATAAVVTVDVSAAASMADASRKVDEALLSRHGLFAMNDANGVPGYECTMCGTVSRSYRDVTAHINGDKHRRNVNKNGVSTALDSDDSSPSPAETSPVRMSTTPDRTTQRDDDMRHVFIVEACRPVTKEMLNLA